MRNDGDRDAEDMSFDVSTLDGVEFVFDPVTEPITLRAGSTLSWLFIPVRHLGSGPGRNVEIVARWVEAGEAKEGTWTVHLN